MKKLTHITLAGFVLSSTATFGLTIPSDGSDGAFNPTSDVVVDLSLAATGAWNSDNSANVGRGVYDPSKWAVVFKYSSVTIPSGVTVRFVNHPTYAPVVWLVSGNVDINGTVSIAGQDSAPDVIGRLTPPEPGPGGFRGGPAGPGGLGAGYGPGSGDSGNYGTTYGNPQIIPLIGGSGAGANFFQGDGTSGAGGGAILMAVAGSVTINGAIDATGGNSTGFWGGGGSGGAVRLVAETVSGTGEIQAIGRRSAALTGRVRIETASLGSGLRTVPETVAVRPAAVPIIWPADDAPICRVVSIDGVAAPEDPTARLVSNSDVLIEKNGVVQVLLQTKNFPNSGVVELRSVQKYGAAAWVTASHLDGNFAESRWVANITFAPGFTTLQARATVP